MSNDGLGKVRQKRSHGPNKPYERRKSLLGRVTDTFKDLIAPSWLSGLVGNSSSDHAQREPPGDIAEQSEDEQFMSPMQSPPNQTHGITMSDNRVPTSDKVSMNHHGKAAGVNSGRLHYPPLGPSGVTTPVLQNSRPARKLESTQPSQGLLRPPLPSQSSKPTQPGPLHAAPQSDGNMSDHSDGSKSTSGSSSMIPHTDKREYQREILQLNDSSLQKLKDQLMVPGALTASTPLPNATQARHSQDTTILHRPDDPGVSSIAAVSPANVTLSKNWSSSFQTSRLRDQAAKSKPSFNMSLFGSPGLGNTSLFGESLHESMFYPGKIGYGGASQFRKGKNRSTAPYEIAAPYRTKIKARPVSKPSSDAITSATAKRILETLERMSTPLTDAKKIPVDHTLSDSVLSFTPTSYLKRPRLAGNNTSFNRRSLGFPLRGPPVSQLTTPTIASIAKNRQLMSAGADLMSKPLKTPDVASETSAIQSQKDPIDLHPTIDIQKGDDETEGMPGTRVDSSSQHSNIRRCDTVVLDSGRKGGKMKRDKSHHYSIKKQDEDDEVVEVPNLKTEFTLPVTNMPKFDFGTAPAAPSPKKPIPIPQTSPPRQDGASQSSSATSMEFTFSNPIPSTKPDFSPGAGTPKLNFQFSSPINMTEKEKSPPSNMFSFTGPKEKAESLLKKSNQSNASELKSGSVMDILGTMSRAENNFTVDKSNPASFQFASAFSSSKPKAKDSLINSSDAPGIGGLQAAPQLKAGSVMDILGGKNSPSTDSSGGFKPAASLKQGSVMDILGGTSSPSTDSPGGFKPAASLKQGSVMDILGGTSSPSTDSSGGFKPATSLKQGSVMDVLGKGAADSKADDTWAKLCAPSDKWECDTCMIRNKPEDSKCVACGSVKPGQFDGNKSSASKPLSAVPPGGSLWDQFKPPEGTWECPTCMIQNKSTSISCVACATSKPASQGTAAPAPPLTNSTGFGSKFLPPAGSWECDTCMIQNKAQDTSCVACQSPKPGTKTSAASGSTTAGTTEKTSSGPWQCDTCLINNKKDSTKCIACETPRPGSKSASGGVTFAPNAFSVGSGFKFDTDSISKDSTSATGFKFGNIEPKGVESKGGFVFGSAPTTVSTTPTVTTTTTGSSTASGFVFGNQNSTDVKPPGGGGFSFSSSSKDSEKSSVGTGFKFGSLAKDSDKSDSSTGTSGFVIGNSSGKSNDSKPTGFVFGTCSSNDSTVGTGLRGTSAGTAEASQKSNSASALSSGVGHSVQCLATAPDLKTDSTGPTGNSDFAFGQSTTDQGSVKTLNNNTEVKPSTPAIGGFSFGATPTLNTEVKPAFGGFSFKKEESGAGGQMTNSSTSGFTGFNAVNTENSSIDKGSQAVKRTSDEADSEPSAKKTFSFSAGTSGTSTAPVFNFSAGVSTSNNGTGTSDLFKFGQQPNTSTAQSSAPLGTGGFNSITSGSTVPAFGSGSSAFGGSAGFGSTQSTTTSSGFGSAPNSAFGQTSGGFGSGASATPFGSTTSDSSGFGAGKGQSSTAQDTSSLFSAKASSTFGGTSTPATGFGTTNSFGSSTGGSFGTDSSTTAFGGFNSTSGFGGSNTFGASTGSGYCNSTPVTTASTATSNTAGFNFTTPGSFNFGSAAPTSGSAVFQFGAKADTGPSAATAPQPPQSQAPPFGLPQPTQQPAPAFNFSAMPNTSFGGSSTPFTFNATPASDKNPFSIQGSIGGRRIKKAVRKARK